MDNKHVKLSVIGFALLLIGLVGVTYSFFNYTRTGSANSLGTGRIYFNTTQGDSLSLTNIFPMTATEASNATLDTVTVGIAGDTTYADGEEFEITLVDVTNTINNKSIPINYIATYTAATGGSIGASNSDYWEDRNDKDSNIYLLNSSGAVTEGHQVLVGYIKNASTGISGTLSISAYVDADRIAISDTYYENAPTPTPTAPNDQYGTTPEWVNGRTVLTTSEWNSLSSNPISFKIKAESNEGLWVEEPIDGTINSCTGCKFIYTTNEYYYSANNYKSSPLSTFTTFANNNETLEEDYREVVAYSGKNYFLGFKFDGSGNVTNAYSCGIKGEEPNNGIAFCIEGALSDTYGGNATTRDTIYNANKNVLSPLYGPYDSGTRFGFDDYGTDVYCFGSVDAVADSRGGVGTEDNIGSCSVDNTGGALCYDY